MAGKKEAPPDVSITPPPGLIPIFAGVEGGGSNTTIVAVDIDGNILADSIGLGTNQFLVGMDECTARIAGLIENVKRKAGLQPDLPLRAVGLSLAGADSHDIQRQIKEAMKRKYPEAACEYDISNDTLCPAALASDKGAVVLIAGTGSNCRLVNHDGSGSNSGGWGHLIGDESSAYWITHFCIKRVFDEEDRFQTIQKPIEGIKKIMFEHFQVQNKQGLLDHFYTNFNKANFALMCVKLADAAREADDAICKEAFHTAGRDLALRVMAVLPSADKNFLAQSGGLKVVCVGSVFKSWDLLKEGFREGLNSIDYHSYPVTVPNVLSMMRLKQPNALGAAYLGARAVNVKLPLNYENNADVFAAFELTSFNRWKEMEQPEPLVDTKSAMLVEPEPETPPPPAKADAKKPAEKPAGKGKGKGK